MAIHQHKYLKLVALSFVVFLLMANWFDARLVQLFGFVNTDAGTLIFPFTFLCGNIITEVYGFKEMRLIIWLAFACNLVFWLYGQFVIHLPSPQYALANNHRFDLLLHAEGRIALASFVAYFIAEPFNALLVAKSKIWLKGRFMTIRFLGANCLASAIGSAVFTVIAFMGAMPNWDLWVLAFTMWLIKVVLEAIFLPISVGVASKLKRIEKVDIYDKYTQFSLFRLNTNYQVDDNHFTRS